MSTHDRRHRYMGNTRRAVILRGLALGAAGSAAMVGCGGPGGSGEKPAANAPPVTIRYVNDVGTPTDDEFNSQVTKRITDKFNGKVNVQVEAFPDPDWAVRYQKYTAM